MGEQHLDFLAQPSRGAAFPRVCDLAGTAFSGAKGQLHWFQDNPVGTVNDKTIVQGDINGDKVADFQIQLAGLQTLTAADLIL